MSDNVVGIGGKTSKGVTPIPQCVALLKDLLAKAEAGHLRQIAFVWIDETGYILDGYAPGAPPHELIPIVGGLELCKATLLSQMVNA